MASRAAGVLLVFALLFSIACGKVSKASIDTGDDFVFLSKFCYSDTGPGILYWTVWTDTPGLNLTLYDDESGSWTSTNGKTCQEKLALAAKNGIVHILDGVPRNVTFNDYSRPHFWYVAVANCGGNGINIQWDLEFLNPGNGWIRQFSFDEQGLLAMYLTFTLVFLIGCGLEGYAAWTYIKAKSLHPLVRLLVLSLFVETIALLCLLIHYAIYADNGIGAPGLKGLGEILDMAAQLAFMLLLVLIAKGWTITSNQLTGKQILIGLMVVFMLSYIALFIWENVGLNPESTLYVYESVPGIIVIIIRCPIIFAWFLWCLRGSYVEETTEHKKRFYLVFGGIYALWFFMLPLIVVIAAMSAPWVRMKTVTAMYLCMNTIGWGILCYLFWPSKAGDYFKMGTGSEGLLAGRGDDNYL